MNIMFLWKTKRLIILRYIEAVPKILMLIMFTGYKVYKGG